MSNSTWHNALQKAKNSPKNELYTRIEDIEKMFSYFPSGLFEGKTILCPCDGPASKFIEYIASHWEELKPKQLLAVWYSPSIQGHYMRMTDPDCLQQWIPLVGHGDFRDEETKPLWQEADFVITNPPFSPMHDFVAQLYAMNKQFCIVAHMMVSLYQRVFPKIYTGEVKVLLAVNNMYFNTPSGKKFEIGNGCWLSNMPTSYKAPEYHIKRTMKENEELGYKYRKYDNYDNVLEISHLKYLPTDYDGVMGVPITFFNWDYSEYKVLGSSTGREEYDVFPTKKYGPMNFFTHDKDGNRIVKLRGGANSDALVEVDKDFSGNYYQELNSDKKLISVFRRVFIQKK